MKKWDRNHRLQTPGWAADILASLVDPPNSIFTILEPTPGEGSLIRALERRFRNDSRVEIITPPPPNWDFWEMPVRKVDWVVANPPFTPFTEVIKYLKAFFKFSDNVISLIPWYTLINSQRRVNYLVDMGLSEVWNLPRYTFPGTRVQTCIIKCVGGYRGKIEFKFASGKNGSFMFKRGKDLV
ncbi:hypothetical protein IIA15_11430 [candidate division TA06 bacterium]|nr:hypothetical protein [candidate division TA06 bacterium]